MDRTLRISLVLSAVDRMTGIISNATNAAIRRMNDLQARSGRYLQQGLALGTAGAGGIALLRKASDAYGELEEASNRMRAAMMGPGGMLDEKTFVAIDRLTNDIGARFPGTAADYKDMVSVMYENGLLAQDILGGTGEAVAKLAALFRMAPASIGQFAARMKQDMGIANNEMIQMTDLIARLKNAGVGKNGEEAVNEMNEAFSKAGLGAANLGVKGIDAAKSLGALMGIFIRRGISGTSVGTNFRRIFDGLRDGEKLNKANEEAHKMGIHLDMFDKLGTFKGIDNFVGQIGKLKGMSSAQIANILRPFGGRQGLSTDFLEFLGKEGTASFNEMQHKLMQQATIDQKVTTMLKGQKAQADITKGTWTNTWAAIGSAFSPELNKIYQTLNKVAVSIEKFTIANPGITKFITIGIAAISVILTIAGALKIVQFAFIALKLVMMGNPILLIIMGIALAAVLVYTYWDKIKAFFISWGAKVRENFLKVWTVIKNLFLNFTPLGLIIKNWTKISTFFTSMGSGIKNVFISVMNFIVTLGPRMFNAGANIVKNVMDGIKSLANKPVEAFKSIMQKIRNHLPFSPAKEGPLRDIHRIRLVETIAENIKAQPAVNAMRKVGTAIMGSGGSSRMQPMAVSGGGITLNFAPVINGANAQNIVDQLRPYAKEFVRMISEEQRKRERTRF